MGRGRNRKPRNFATFRLCPRPGAADASDRVFVRVDDNPYSVPGFADDGVGASSSGSTAVGGEGETTSAEYGGGALPDHVRREILELGLPDDGYDYLAHLRELRPSLSSTGGGYSAVFLHSRRPARSALPVDVKAYDASRVPIGSGKIVETAMVSRRVEEAIDVDVAELLQESDVPAAAELGDENLEEDFVMLANLPEEDEQIEEGENIGVTDAVDGDKVQDGRSKEKVHRLRHEKFDSLALEGYADGEDDGRAQDVQHELSQKVIRTLESSIKEQNVESSNAILECSGHAERYSDERREEEQVVFVPESSDGYLDLQSGKILAPENARKKLPNSPPGVTSMKKAIIKKGVEKLPTEYLPQRKT